jgi:NADH:ubiquinone oxidoreductase subunit 4 (subunit M)
MVVCLLVCLMGLIGLGIAPRPLAESSRQAVAQTAQVRALQSVEQVGQR